jgi:hypothetical protein
MAPGEQARGQCAFCGHVTTKAAMRRHSDRCVERLAEDAEASARKPETLHRLRIESADAPTFWLDVEVRGSTTLERIDHYLRVIWLDCCGHLSEFSLDGWGADRVGMSRKVDAAFRDGSELTHIYDFGTESITKLREVDRRQGVPLTAHPLSLLARNVLPEVACVDCDQPASHLCLECQHEWEAPGTLCPKHADDHPHQDYGEPIELVNSPRVGMCGEVGSAEPPY